ncbi:MAG: alpha/beta hydrolase [Bryobacteraceae bacterium]|jgi:pimeloyl-ACP methyl ester carboxylesterase
MTRFLDVRLWPVGGPLRTDVNISQGDVNTYQGLNKQDLLNDIRGRDVLIGVHGFNVSRSDGVAALSNWEGLLQLGPSTRFAGVLWPGDSVWLHGLDYPEAPRIADEAGQLIGPFLDQNFGGAASISFASHSLGARVVLSTIASMKRSVKRLILMAGAIDDDCLTTEFQSIVPNVGEISVLASIKDDVLAMAFPLGNLTGGILTTGHPWLREALGRGGPSRAPDHFRPHFEIPSNWNYGHWNYLQVAPPPPLKIAVPQDVPVDGTACPSPLDGWQSAWSAAVTSTRFQ